MDVVDIREQFEIVLSCFEKRISFLHLSESILLPVEAGMLLVHQPLVAV